MPDFIRVLNEEDLPAGENRAVDAFGTSVLICRTAEGIFAVTNECTHQKNPLEGGRMRGHHIFCPVHGVRFDLRNGCPAGRLTDQPLQCFEVRARDGGIEVAQLEKEQSGS